MMNDEWWMMNDEWWMINDEWWMMSDDEWMSLYLTDFNKFYKIKNWSVVLQ